MTLLPHRLRSRTVVVCVGAACVYVAAAAAQSQDIATLRKQAKDGNAEAQYVLAQDNLTGTGVPRNSKEGIDWLRKAADQDHPAAQLALSHFYLTGEQNVAKDPKQGLQWLQKSADHGYAAAEYTLGLLYRDGNGETGIPRKPHEAAVWFRKAARQPNSTGSRASLEEMLQKGLITKQEANWHAEPTRVAEKGKPAPFSLAEVETGLKNWITNKRMAALVQQFGVNFKLNPAERKRLQDAGAEESLLNVISLNKRS
jgi:TPR repeat protein